MFPNRIHNLVIFCLVSASFVPLFADVERQTSINDVFNRGSAELAGSITMTVDADDFAAASPEAPIYIRIQLGSNTTLAKTLVDTQSAVSPFNQPIYLAVELIDIGDPATTVNVPQDAVSIVRWISGEDAIWLCISRSSSTWITRNGMTTEAPSADHKLSWTLGISARSSTYDHTDPDKSNRPFNARNIPATDDVADATSTSICSDFSQSTLTLEGEASLLFFTTAAFGPGAADGNGNFTAVDPLAIAFTNDDKLARGKTRSCQITDDAEMFLETSVDATRDGDFATIIRSFRPTIRCDRGGWLLDTVLFNGSVFHLRVDTALPVGFSGEAPEIAYIDDDEIAVIPMDPFTVNGRTLYRQLDLQWVGGFRGLDKFRLDIFLPLTAPHALITGVGSIPRLDAAVEPVSVIVNFWADLVNHDGAADLKPFDGIDQDRRCAPSVYPLDAISADEPFTFFPVSSRKLLRGDSGSWSAGTWDSWQPSGDVSYAMRNASILEAVDITDPATPQITDQINFVDEVQGPAVADGRAFVGFADGALVYETDEMGQLQQVAWFGQGIDCQAISVAGNLAFLADALETTVFDITTPTSPIELTTLDRSARGARARPRPPDAAR